MRHARLATGPAIASAADDAHWYATANVGANFMSDQMVSLSGDGPTQSGDASLSSGLLTGAAVGRAFSRSFRAEAEFVYQSVDHDGVRLAGKSSLPSGNVASTALALNGLYSFNLFGREEVRTYVGLGVAWLTEVDIDFEQGGQEVSCSGDGFGVQLLAGARYYALGLAVSVVTDLPSSAAIVWCMAVVAIAVHLTANDAAAQAGR